MFISEELKAEMDFFRRTNEHFEIQAGKATCKLSNASDEMLYMAMSASLVMDYSEDGFFENFVITDKAISGKDEMQMHMHLSKQRVRLLNNYIFFNINCMKVKIEWLLLLNC